MRDVTRVCKELPNTEVFFQSAGGRADRINDTASYVAPLFLRLRGLEELKAEFVGMFHIRSS